MQAKNGYGGRLGNRLGELTGDLHDSVMISLRREAQPLPDSIPLDRVRALHSSQVFGLVRDVLKDQLDAWESRLQRMNDELRRTQNEKARLEATAEIEQPRLEREAAEARAQADWLARERSRLEDRIDELQAALRAREADLAREKLARARERTARLVELESVVEDLESQRPEVLQERLAEVELSCKRARTASRRAAQRSMALECELSALRGALEEQREKSRVLAESNALLRRKLEAQIAYAQKLEGELDTAQRAYKDLWTLSHAQEERIQQLTAQLELAQNAKTWAAALEGELAERLASLDAHAERERALTEERELVNAALAATDSAMEALQRELKAARKVQRLSEKLGKLSAPGGADELRETRPDYPLFAELQAAQAELKESWLRLHTVHDDLQGVRGAVQGRVEGSPWLRKELARLKSELEASRRRAESLEKAHWTTQTNLEEREAMLTVLEDDLLRLEGDLEEARTEADTSRFRLDVLRPDLEGLQRELSDAADALHSREQEVADLQQTLERVDRERREEAEHREQITREAMQALQAADAELETEREAKTEHATARYTLEGKVDLLQRALHRQG